LIGFGTQENEVGKKDTKIQSKIQKQKHADTERHKTTQKRTIRDLEKMHNVTRTKNLA
jgi:hypothetical protein